MSLSKLIMSNIRKKQKFDLLKDPCISLICMQCMICCLIYCTKKVLMGGRDDSLVLHILWKKNQSSAILLVSEKTKSLQLFSTAILFQFQRKHSLLLLTILTVCCCSSLLLMGNIPTKMKKESSSGTTRTQLNETFLENPDS